MFKIVKDWDYTMSEYKLNTVSGGTVDLKVEGDLVAHFANNDQNHAQTILNQINEQHFYDRYFQGQTGLTVLDIGANIGLFSIHVFGACKRLIALEPTPEHYDKLLRLCEEYVRPLEGPIKMTALQVALSNTDGLIAFNRNPHNTTMNSIVGGEVPGSVFVRSVRLSTLLNQEGLDNVDFCKIDIEGSEMIAITSEEVAATAGRIKNWFVEAHPTPGFSQEQNMQTLMEIFTNNGYNVDRTNFETFVASLK